MKQEWAAIKPLVAAMALLLAGTSMASGVLPELEKAEQLLRDGHGADALAVLAPLESAQAGNPRFDYLLGTAALGAGHADQASLALERAVAVDPLHAGARIELARAYFLLGDLQRAKAEFKLVEQLNPPPAARLVVDNYLKAIADKESAQRFNASAYVEATIGYDSNINNATDRNRIAVPALRDLIVTLNPANIQTRDSFRAVAAGGEISAPIGDGFSWIMAANVQRRDHFHHGQFDTAGLDVKGGIAFAEGGDHVQLSALAGRMFLGNQLNRTVAGITGEWRNLLDSHTQLGVSTQYLQYRFPAAELAANNFNQWISSLGVSHLLSDDKTALSANLLLGREHDTNRRADGAKKIHGLQLTGRRIWDDDIDYYVSFGWINGRYGSINPAFEKKRRDDEFHSSIGMTYKLTRQITLRPELNFIRNRSNLPVFDFHEAAFSLKVRYDFMD